MPNNTLSEAAVTDILSSIITEIVRELEIAGCSLPPLPPGWSRGHNRRTYWHEHDSHTSTSLDPRFLPPQWEMRLDLDGKPYFASHVMKLTTFVDPRGLPANWRMLVEDATGKVYFANDTLHCAHDPARVHPPCQSRIPAALVTNPSRK